MFFHACSIFLLSWSRQSDLADVTMPNSASQDTGSDCGLAGGNDESGAGDVSSLTVGLAAGPVQDVGEVARAGFSLALLPGSEEAVAEACWSDKEVCGDIHKYPAVLLKIKYRCTQSQDGG